MNLPLITAKMHRSLALFGVLIGHMRSRGQILRSQFRRLVRPLFSWKFSILTSIFGICAFLLLVISFNFLESRAIFTDLSFFIVITAGLTKQFSIEVFKFFNVPLFFQFFFFFFYHGLLMNGDRAPLLLYQFGSLS